MDVTVTEVEDLPAHTFISVRCGEVRKQAPFRVGEALSFPTPSPSKSGAPEAHLPKAFTVDVFRKVGSKQISLAGITAQGGTMRHEGILIPSLEIQGSPVRASLTAILKAVECGPSGGLGRSQQ
ncbi:unnamed protein product, partial [Polarella glacialis]